MWKKWNTKVGVNKLIQIKPSTCNTYLSLSVKIWSGSFTTMSYWPFEIYSWIFNKNLSTKDSEITWLSQILFYFENPVFHTEVYNRNLVPISYQVYFSHEIIFLYLQLMLMLHLISVIWLVYVCEKTHLLSP